MLIGQKLVLTGSSPCETPSHGIDPCHQIRTDPFAITWKLNLTLVGSQRTMMNGLQAGLGYAVSDGSYKDDAGAAAWIIEGSDSTSRLIGTWYTPGTTDNHSSFRSKIAGIILINQNFGWHVTDYQWSHDLHPSDP